MEEQDQQQTLQEKEKEKETSPTCSVPEVTLVDTVSVNSFEEGWTLLEAGIDQLIALIEKDDKAKLPNDIKSSLYTYVIFLPLEKHFW